jgi:hypothetical protein
LKIKHNIPSSLKSAFSALYGYTSDEGGIRYSLLEKDVKIDRSTIYVDRLFSFYQLFTIQDLNLR